MMNLLKEMEALFFLVILWAETACAGCGSEEKR